MSAAAARLVTIVWGGLEALMFTQDLLTRTTKGQAVGSS
jgi:hypothetical protein